MSSEESRRQASLALQLRDVYKQMCSTAEGRAEASTAFEMTREEAQQAAARSPSAHGGKSPKGSGRKGYGRLGLGYLEAREEETGVWWPVSLVCENANGTFRVKVHETEPRAGGAREMVVPQQDLRAVKRRTAVLLPKGATAWTTGAAPEGKGRPRRAGVPNKADRQKQVAVVVRDAAGAEKTYYTLERCYEDLGRARQEKGLLEKEVASLRARMRQAEKQGALQLDDLIAHASPMARLTTAPAQDGRKPSPKQLKHWEDVHNVLIREDPSQSGSFVVRGTPYDCRAVADAMQATVEKEASDDDIAVNTAVRVTDPGTLAKLRCDAFSIAAVGFVHRIDAAASPPVYTVQLPGGTESLGAHQFTALQSPVLWSTAAKTSTPVADARHVAILKNEVSTLRDRLLRAEQQLEARRGASTKHDDEVKRIAAQVEQQDAGAAAHAKRREQVQALESNLKKSEAQIAELNAQLSSLVRTSSEELKTMQQKVRVEKAARIQVERTTTLEGQWVADPKHATDDQPRVYEIVRTNADELVFRQLTGSFELSGRLVEAGARDAPAAMCGVAEFYAELSDGGCVWLGRIEGMKLLSVYKAGRGRAAEVVRVAAKLKEALPLPAGFEGVCPRCGQRERGSESSSEKDTLPPSPRLEPPPPPPPAPARRPSTPPVENTLPPPVQASEPARVRELLAVIRSKDAELQSAIRAMETLRLERDVAPALPVPVYKTVPPEGVLGDYIEKEATLQAQVRGLQAEIGALKARRAPPREQPQQQARGGGAAEDALKAEVARLQGLLDAKGRADGSAREAALEAEAETLRRELAQAKSSPAPAGAEPSVGALQQQLAAAEAAKAQADADAEDLRRKLLAVEQGASAGVETRLDDLRQQLASAETLKSRAEAEAGEQKAQLARKQATFDEELQRLRKSLDAASAGLVLPPECKGLKFVCRAWVEEKTP
ncbi:hypothetical protein DIPPA_31865 [Diplonema papillatum]|nr:hypothetical protein DIPPA_31865 [Diplonema papillatum]